MIQPIPSTATPLVRRASRRVINVIGTPIDVVSYTDVVQQVFGWAKLRESRYVCCANVHMVMEAHDDVLYRKLLERADIITPDGRPLVWALRMLGANAATSVRGPDLTALLCLQASKERVSVGFYGASPRVLADLISAVTASSPRLIVAYRYSPPFRKPTEAETASTIKDINRSGVGILFVGLGCPKQERWMAEHQHKVRAVMLGTGAAFDLLSGHRRRAPRWLQDAGLEWLFRLVLEPKRLWRRYLLHNPRYLALLLRQLLQRRLS